MSHQEILWLLEAAIEAAAVLGPVAVLGFLTWRVAR